MRKNVTCLFVSNLFYLSWYLQISVFCEQWDPILCYRWIIFHILHIYNAYMYMYMKFKIHLCIHTYAYWFYMHSSIHGFRSWFHILGIINIAIMNIEIQICLWYVYLTCLQYIPIVGWLDHMVNLFFLREFYTVLHNGYTNLKFHQLDTTAAFSSYPLYNLLYFLLFCN